MRNASRFALGSGCYTCRSCGRSTRATGGDNQECRLCAECYELAEIENAYLDGVPEAWMPQQAARLYKLIQEKGGVPNFHPDYMEELLPYL